MPRAETVKWITNVSVEHYSDRSGRTVDQLGFRGFIRSREHLVGKTRLFGSGGSVALVSAGRMGGEECAGDFKVYFVFVWT